MAIKPTEAFTRLPLYNGNAYDPATNPYGMALGGHRVNFPQSLYDTTAVGLFVEQVGNEAATSATNSANSATSADASRQLAERWASNPEDLVVSGGLYSARHYAAKAAASATAAATFNPANYYTQTQTNTLLNAKANNASPTLSNPTLTGTVAAPTRTKGDRTNNAATTSFIGNELADYPRLDGTNAGPLGGFRNKIINPNGTINQRRLTGGYTNGVYREDRWRGHTNGKEQLIEPANAPAGTYTLSWAGGGQGRANGSALATSPITVTVPGGANVSVVVPTGATAVQFEMGTAATPLEQRHPIIELILCMAYCQKTFPQGTVPSANQGFDGAVIAAAVGTNMCGTWSFAVPMRAIPSLTTFNPANDATPGWRNFASNQTVTATIHSVTERCVNVIATAAASNQFHGIHFIAQAEL